MFTLLEAGVKPRWAGCKQPYQVLVWLIKSVGASGAVVQFPRGRQIVDAPSSDIWSRIEGDAS
jgi:hypothetical protein